MSKTKAVSSDVPGDLIPESDLFARRYMRILKSIGECSRGVNRAESEQELMDFVCDRLVSVGGYRLVGISFIKHDAEKSIDVRAHRGFGGELPKNARYRITWDETQPSGRGAIGQAIRTAKPCAIQHFQTRVELRPWAPVALELGYDAVLALPVKLNDVVIGVMALYSEKSDAFGSEEIGLLQGVADDLSYGIGIIRLRAELAVEAEQRAALETQLRHSQKMQAIGQLTGGIAHDFNNRLAVISASLEILNEEISAGQSGLVAAARGAAKSAADLVSRLLAFSRSNPVSQTRIEIVPKVSAVLELLARVIGPTVDLKIEFSGEIWDVFVDADQFESALTNIVTNARDALPTSGGEITIRIANAILDGSENAAVAKCRGEFVEIRVIDTGSGIATEHLDRVCEPFFTTKPAGKGTGLGLSLVYGFSKQSSGALVIESPNHGGTIVSLYLPRAELAVRERQSEPSVAAGSLSGSETILVVEDEEDLRTTVASGLRRYGYKVVEAQDGTAAMALLQEKGPVDLIFTDTVMPGGISGFELVQWATGNWPDIKWIITTGHAAPEYLNAETRASVLRKPYEIREVLVRARKIFAAPIGV